MAPALHRTAVKATLATDGGTALLPVPASLAAALAAINGRVTDTYGSGLPYTRVVWKVGAVTGSAKADSQGYYSFSGIPAAVENGRLSATSEDGISVFYDWTNQSWAAPGPTPIDIQPGLVTIQGNPGGPWRDSATHLGTDVFTSAGIEKKEAWAHVPSLTTSAPALPGTVTGVAAYFYDSEGVEATAVNGQSVTAASTLAQSVSVDEAGAQRIWTGGSYVNLSKPWGSGKPGSKQKVWLQNFPSNWTNAIDGYSENPARSAGKHFGSLRSLGTSRHSRTLTVPPKAVPGYGYRVRFSHTNGPLELSTWFQICTLKASKSAVRKGTAIRFSGVVPVQDHHGSTAGKRTTAYMFVHKGTAGQPTNLNPTKQGWHYVGSFKTDGYGKYRTSLLKPQLTMSVVMQYPGDDCYYPAYTSPVKVTVR